MGDPGGWRLVFATFLRWKEFMPKASISGTGCSRLTLGGKSASFRLKLDLSQS